jgi:pimeloyl-ACP methyl ester carboxylesterase
MMIGTKLAQYEITATWDRAEWETCITIASNSRSRQAGAPAQPPLVEKTLAKLETIKTPTLLLPADSDLTAPPYIMRTLAMHIPGSELHLISEAGHFANWEQPEMFNRLVLEFLSKYSNVSNSLPLQEKSQ